MTSSNPGHSMLADLARVKDARTGRLSSWDQEGKNQDYWLIPANSTVRLAEIEGPGCITHIWMTQFCRRVLGAGLIDPTAGNYVAPVFEIHNALGLNWEIADPHYYRKVLLKIYWDDQDTPSVLAPLGDFFCTGHSMPGNFSSLPISVSCKPEERFRFGGSAAFNSYFQMPFGKRAIIEIENQNDVPYGQYFYIDFERYEAPLADDIAYFHANWRRENPCEGWGPNLQTNSPETNIPNLDGKENYVILETEGRGQYVGCNLSVAHFQGSWWGEGDEMIFVDEDSWPPSIHGTGTEDYFNHAWGMQNNAFLMNGSVIHESIVPGYQVSYRFHLTDPVRFKNRIRVTIEHGHANHLSDDWASTAYWYQTLPSPKLTILPVEQRLPTPPGDRVPERVSRDRLTVEQAAQIDAADERFRTYAELRDIEIEKKLETTRRRSAENVSRR
ncbi:hypothetical protein B5K08_02265 [Rhizobium leguminosarum bv. trifolii]|uniref:DUF2961 domain-containing protein n=1 Tax=Rhizobium leguminosarum bv. trifolii TaxID=386 RepID=A0A3E1BZG0_RHILT|nr:glycoside hydrolase family 172 protein [Rhizobium leguminosarum]RFC00706.1 hypothetical protein B5K08_02265 [Rhizobium leguminosarum bv. trifolii]RFC01161.1 hypothetical protein B5K10_02260 [Rhizobium leguminosarum bv. trifolii]